MSNIRELIRSFSFTPLLKSNISSAPAIPGVKGAARSSIAEPTALISDRYLSTYYARVNDLKNYEMTELSETIVGLYEDYITSYIKDDIDHVVSIDSNYPNFAALEGKIDKVFKDLDLIPDIRIHLWDYIYYGGYSYCINWDGKSRKFTKKLLVHPNNLVKSFSSDQAKSYLVQSKGDTIQEVDPRSIAMIGVPRMELYDDISEEAKKKSLVGDGKKDDTLYTIKQYRACKPLFYGIIGRLKEYLLKDQLINLLSIKDLIMPLVYIVGYDKNTPPDVASKLTTNLENLINKYADLSIVVEANYDINVILEQINNNLKLVTDYNQQLANTGALDLIKVNDRINELRADQDNLRNNILQAAGIPESLFDGSGSKWEAIKSSQRLSSRVKYYLDGLKESIKLIAASVVFMTTGEDIPLDKIKVNLFNATEVDYNNSVNSAELISSVLQSITDVIDKAKSTVESYGDMINKGEFMKFMVSKLHEISNECDDWINEETIKPYLDSMKNSEGEDEEGGFGGFGGGF